MDHTQAEPVSHRAFISYSSLDADAANAVLDALETKGVACWIAPRDIPLGSRYGEEIINGINACSLFVLLLSERSNASPQVLAEIERAVSKNIPILPIRLEAITLTKSLEYFLSSFHWIDAFPAIDPHLNHIVRAVRTNFGMKASDVMARTQCLEASASQPPDPSSVRQTNNLPEQATSFIGREKEIADIKALLDKTRLLTLTGAGGCGKTRLALHAAASLLAGDGDGVWLVELASLSDPALVAQTVADVFCIRAGAGKTVMQALLDGMKPKRLLLVLDNCEHLVAACAALASDLLRHCPEVHLLASSREPLNIAGEHVYRVPSLSLPDAKRAQTVEGLAQSEAVRLFIARAQVAQPVFSLCADNAPAVAQLCRHLDGIPLALELAASRVRALSVAEIDARLDKRFRLLTGGSRTALPRQQTLRALIDWSYDLLTEPEKTLFQRLSVFAGGWTLEAAEGVCAGDDIEDWEVLDLLTSLLDKSLAVTDVQEQAVRYRLSETVRQYGADRLAENASETTARERHAAWFLRFAEHGDQMLRGPAQPEWLDRVEAEHDNLRTALTWYAQQDGEKALCLAVALGNFWHTRGHVVEGRQWFHRVLERSAEAAPSLARVWALHWAAEFTDDRADYAAVRTLREECLSLHRQMGNQYGAAWTLFALAGMAYSERDVASALSLYEDDLALFRQLGDPIGAAWCFCLLGEILSDLGDYAPAKCRLDESLSLFRQSGNQHGIATVLLNLGRLSRRSDDFDAARKSLGESLALFRELKEMLGTAEALECLGDVALREGQADLARRLCEESVEIHQQQSGDHRNAVWRPLLQMGTLASHRGDLETSMVFFRESLRLSSRSRDLRGVACGLDAVAAVAIECKQFMRAIRLLGASESLRCAIHYVAAHCERRGVEQGMSVARNVLGDHAFTQAWDEGRAMTPEAATDYALTGE